MEHTLFFSQMSMNVFTAKHSMDQIREELNFIVTNYHKNDEDKSLSSQVSEVSHRLMSALDSKDRCVERLYVLYYLCEIVSHLSQSVCTSEADRFLKALFPTENLSQRQANLMSQLISLALSVRNQEMLTCSAHYLLTCDRISLNSSSSLPLPESLAQDSPAFCSAIISKGYFTSTSKQLLTKWLNTLTSSTGNDNSLVLNSSIRFSLLEGSLQDNLQLAILSTISQRKCLPLSNHFLIDISTVISQRTNNSEMIDRLAQIIIVASSSGMCSLSNQLKSILQSKFPSNNLISAFCQFNK